MTGLDVERYDDLIADLRRQLKEAQALAARACEALRLVAECRSVVCFNADHSRGCDCGGPVIEAILSDPSAEAAAKWLEEQKAEAARRMLRIAVGCFDYGGGYRSNDEKLSIFHHGIQTVVNALTAAINDPNNPQTQVLERIGGPQ